MNFDNIWCWLIPLLVGALCALLGYLWGKGKNGLTDNTKDIKALKEENTSLRTDLEACTKKLATAKMKAGQASSKAENETLAASLDSTIATGIAFDASAAKAAFGKSIKENDLKIVEGIGPKIEGLFHNFGIKGWKDLSETAVDKCQEVLNSGGDRYRLHDPSSWPMQAKMAYEGKWKDLVKWQDGHKSGKF